MKGDRRLRLVSPSGDEPTPPDRDDAEVAGALRAAYGLGAPLPEAVHEDLLAKALGPSPVELSDAPPSAEERRAADQLRMALEARGEPVSAGGQSLDAETAALVTLARALSAAHRPGAIDELRNQSLVSRTLGRDRNRRRMATVTGVLFATAAAAAAVFGLQLDGARSPSSAEVEAVALSSSGSLAVSRSTQDLFDAAVPFERTGGTSERVDRIARSRASELRANRFARWGVQ